MEKELKEILELSLDIHYYYDLEKDKFIYINPSIKDHFEVTPDDIIGKHYSFLYDIIHPEDREIFESHWNSIAFNQQLNTKSNSTDYRCRTLSGKFFWFNDSHRYVRNNNGRITGIVGCIRDITDVKVVEILKSNTKERMNLAMEAASDSIWEWKVSSNKLFLDARFYSILGYDPYEFPDTFPEWESRMHPDDKKMAIELLKKCATGVSDQIHIEYRIATKQNNWKWILCRAKVSGKNDVGKVIKIIGTQTDITKLKEAEDEIRKQNTALLEAEKIIQKHSEALQVTNNELKYSEEKFRELAENTNDAFLLRDENNILYINPSFVQVWGRTREEVFENQHHFEKWVHPEDRNRFTKWDDFNAFSELKNYSEQYRIIKDDGSIRWLWSRIHPVFNSEGKIYRLAVIATDITEQKETEEALVRAKEKAMESDRLKSAFLANISHEIRTPMNGILGFIDLLNEENLSQSTKEQYLQIISNSSKQLLQIINDIIDISKIEANQINIEVKECNINLAIKDIFLFFQQNRLVKENSKITMQLELPLEEEYAKIYTDEARVSQIMMNLIDNSVKFTCEGEIIVGYKIVEKNIVFFVKDTGIGIPQNQHHLIFDRFIQIDDSATRKFGGTGLGLSICQGLVKLLGGTIWFDSEEMKGTTFYVSLPFIPVKRTDTDDSLNVDRSMPNWKNKTILIVEDDFINFEYLNTVLETSEANILHAATGEDAIRIFASNKTAINLVLMDIRLPGINGYQAMKSIKDLDSKIPVVAQTAFAMAEDNQNCLEQGFDDYIAKPINRKHLLQIIQNHIL
jgi:two-component system sensor histidine kinase/response regulator